MLIGHIDDGAFQRFVGRPIDLADDHLRSAHLNLVPLPTHGLDQDSKLELTSTGHLRYLGRRGVADTDGHVAQNLAVEPLPNLT